MNMVFTRPCRQVIIGNSNKSKYPGWASGVGGVTWLAFSVLPLLLSGCAPAVTRPAPVASHHSAPPAYRIRPGDLMDVKFYYTPELNESLMVRPDGKISLQLAQDIPAAGLTPAELTHTLIHSYAREISNPEISVIMRSFEGQRVFVDGQVNKPGSMQLTPNMTVMQTLSNAGGLHDTAKIDGVLLIRRGPTGNPTVFSLDLTRVLDGTDTRQDVALQPFDIVYVPRSAIANLNLWVDQYLRKSIPIGFSLPTM